MPCVEFCWGRKIIILLVFLCVVVSCVLVSAAGVVGGIFEVAGGGVDSTDTGLSLEAAGAWR